MKYQPGQSGNPKGRPPGVLNQAKLRETIAKDLPDILAALAVAAKGGDVMAARALLDRTLPVLKATDQAVALPIVGDLGTAATAVLAALVAGDVTPDQAASVAAVLGALARVKEVSELEQRIAQLEAARVDKP